MKTTGPSVEVSKRDPDAVRMPTIKHYVNFRDQQIIYARIPKVANTSIKTALATLLKERPAGKRFTTDAFWRTMTHGETEMISAKSAWRQRKEKVVFSFVRNPLDRLVSCYSNKILEKASFTPQMEANGFEVGMSFPDFVDRVAAQPDEALDVHIASQSHMLTHDGVLVPNFIGHFEDLDFEWFRLRRKLLVELDVTLPDLAKKNFRRSDRSDVAKFFADKAVLRTVLERYSNDFALFYPGVSPSDLISGEFTAPKALRQRLPKPSEKASVEG